MKFDNCRRLSRPALAILSLLAALSAPVGAQMPERPRLDRDADPNSWESYYDAGVALLQRGDTRAADAAFVWASHLQPDRAEPLYARWVAFWANDLDQFPDYLRDDERVWRDARVVRADSLREGAFRRNPFVHQGLVMLVFDRLAGHFSDDQLTNAWLSLGQAQLSRALEQFGRLVSRDPATYGYLRFVRASAFVNSARNDSATAEITALLSQLRAADEKTLGRGYQSKEVLEYALGLLMVQTRRTSDAREAFGRAVAENAAFAPAHAMLGRLAVTARDTTTALTEYGLAVEIEPDNAAFRVGLGNALVLAKRQSDAAAAYKRAVEMEPLYADPYYLLAGTLEALGDGAGASTRYKQFLDRATRSDARRVTAEAKKGSPPD
jgi:tetratricopeptide (TPR) repeat protein